MVLRTEAFTYLLKGILVLLCLSEIPARAENYRQDPADSAFSSENSAYQGGREFKRHITEEYSTDNTNQYSTHRNQRETETKYRVTDYSETASRNYRKKKYQIQIRKKPATERKRTPSSKKRLSGRQKNLRYRIRRGDTLYSIARKHGVSVKELRRINGLSSGSRIKSGQTLKITSGNDKKSPVRGVSYNPKRNPGKTKGKRNPAFSWPLRRVTGYHRDSTNGVKAIGLVIKSRPGAAVYSSAAGTVRHIGYMRGYGNFIILQHRDRYITVYSNLENIQVSRGEKIRRGGQIGRLGGDQKLHFQIDYAGKAKNPLRYLPKKGEF